MVFLCYIEVLGQNIRNNDKIHGIKVTVHNELEIKSGQFANNTILFSMFQQESSQAVMDTRTEFERNSGLRLNYE